MPPPRVEARARSFGPVSPRDAGDVEPSSATSLGKAVVISSVTYSDEGAVEKERNYKEQILSRHQQVISSGRKSGGGELVSESTTSGIGITAESTSSGLGIAADFEGESRSQPSPLPAGSRRRHKKVESTWIEAEPCLWRAEIRSARAHRLPPGVGWSDVARRVTSDSRTEEVLEDTSEVGELLNQEFAVRRLDRVRDISVEVRLHKDWCRAQPGKKWADIESD